jgi:hypothetical protein
MLNEPDKMSRVCILLACGNKKKNGAQETATCLLSPLYYTQKMEL